MAYPRRAIAALTLCSTLFLASPAAVSGQETISNPQMKLGLREGALLLLENNIDVTIERTSTPIASTLVEKELARFDPEVYGSFKRLDSTSPLSARSSAASGGLKKIESETYSLNTGITGKTTLGTTYTFEVKDDWSADTLNRFQYEYDSFAGVRVTQPLLKDFGTGPNEQPLMIARKDRSISVHRLKGRITSLIADYGTAYWDLVRAKEELKVRTETQDLARTLLDISRKKLEAGTISALELKGAEAAEATRKDEVYLAESFIRTREKTLKLLISRDIYRLRDTEIVPEAIGPSLPIEGLDASVLNATKNRPDYLEAKTEIEKQNLRISFAKDQSWPKLDLEASYGYNGLGTSFSDSFTEMDSNPEWSVGVVFRYPLGNRASLGELSASRIEAGRALLRLKKIEQEIVIGIDTALKEIESGRIRVEASKRSTSLTIEALEAEEKKLSAGRSTTYNVLKAQEDLAKARLTEINAVSDYNKALIRYHSEKGTLLEAFSIIVKDWPSDGP